MTIRAAEVEAVLTAKDQMTDVLKRAHERVGGLAGVFKVASLALGGASVAFAGFGLEAVRHTEEAGHAAFEMSQKFGLLPGQASAWVAAAKQVGVSGDEMSLGFRFAARNMENMNIAFAAGKKLPAQQAEAFKELNVHLLDAHNKLRPLNEVMLDVADRFKEMADGPEKAGLAMKVFGRSGTALIPVLNEGRDGLLRMMEAGKKAGAVMSDDQVKAAQAAFLAHQRFNVAVEGLATQLGIKLLPALTKVADWLTTTGIPKMTDFINKVIIPLGKEAANAADKAKPLAKPFEDAAAALALMAKHKDVVALLAGLASTVVTIRILTLVGQFIEFILAFKEFSKVAGVGKAIMAALGLSAAGISGPFLLIAVAIGIAVALIILFITHKKEIMAVLDKVRTAIDRVVVGTKDMVEKIGHAIEKVTKWISEHGKLIAAMFLLMNPIISVIRTIVELIKFVDFIRKHIVAWAEVLGKTLFAALVSVVHWIGQVIGGIIKFFAHLGEVHKKVVGFAGALGNLGGALLNTGKQLIEGFWRGIQDAWGAVLRALPNMVKQVTDVFAMALGLRSPSKVFFEMGQNISKGLQLGVTAGGAAGLGGLRGPGVQLPRDLVNNVSVQIGNDVLSRYIERVALSVLVQQFTR